jgi:endonuclease-3
MAQAVVANYGGEVPDALDDLVTLPGVGRKTGNVVRSVWFHEPGLPVDTHVTRLSARLRLTNETDPVKIEHDVGGIVSPEEWGDLSLRLIEHGRRVCDARRPRCSECALAEVCPSAGRVAGAI